MSGSGKGGGEIILEMNSGIESYLFLLHTVLISIKWALWNKAGLKIAGVSSNQFAP